MSRRWLATFTFVSLLLLPVGSAMSSVTECNSEQLQGTSCENPKDCWNACAFWCSSMQTCKQCCLAFPRESYARRACNAACDSIPWEQ